MGAPFTRYSVVLAIALLFVPSVVVANVKEKEAELERRMKHWEAWASWCEPAGKPPYISKYYKAEVRDPKNPRKQENACNDGDTVLFSGLTCASGDERGCDTVIRSISEKDGLVRWWRSPGKIGVPEGSETSFSNDHGRGVLLYLLHKKDGDTFYKWNKWIGRRPVPRFCDDDRCVLYRPVDCPLLDRVGAVLGKANLACDPAIRARAVVRELRDEFKKAVAPFRRAGLMPRILPLEKEFERVLDRVEKLHDNLAEFEARLNTHVRAESMRAVELLNKLSSFANKEGFARHNVAVVAYLLKKYGGVTGKEVSEAAVNLTTLEPRNAFFEYVAYGPTERMLDQILAKCPSAEGDKNKSRFQWIWERPDWKEDDWSRPMYWDCLFVARLYRSGPIKGLNFPASPLTDEKFKTARATALAAASGAENAARELIEKIKKIKPPVPGKLPDNFDDVVNEAKKLLPGAGGVVPGGGTSGTQGPLPRPGQDPITSQLPPLPGQKEADKVLEKLKPRLPRF